MSETRFPEGSPASRLDERIKERTLPMSLDLFRRDCLQRIAAEPEDDPLADHHARTFAINALLLCREFEDYRAAHAQAVQRLTEERRSAESAGIELKMIFDAVLCAMRGEAVSDFEESFPEIREAQALRDRAEQAEAALAALRAQVAALPDPILLDSHFVTDPFFCKWCRASWNVKKQKDWDGTFYRCVGALAHPDNGCLARLRPRPEGST